MLRFVTEVLTIISLFLIRFNSNLRSLSKLYRKILWPSLIWIVEALWKSDRWRTWTTNEKYAYFEWNFSFLFKSLHALFYKCEKLSFECRSSDYVHLLATTNVTVPNRAKSKQARFIIMVFSNVPSFLRNSILFGIRCHWRCLLEAL